MARRGGLERLWAECFLPAGDCGPEAGGRGLLTLPNSSPGPRLLFLAESPLLPLLLFSALCLPSRLGCQALGVSVSGWTCRASEPKKVRPEAVRGVPAAQAASPGNGGSASSHPVPSARPGRERPAGGRVPRSLAPSASRAPLAAQGFVSSASPVCFRSSGWGSLCSWFLCLVL